MKSYQSENIRNIGIIGHGDSGKTSLVSALLFLSGAVNRLGRVEDGNTVTDHGEDEIDRGITISTGLAHCEWRNNKLNFLDTPGYSAFLLDAKAALRAVETGLTVIDATAGVEVQTEKVWEFCEELNLPRILVINKLDRDRASYERSFKSLQERFGRQVVSLQLPIGEETGFRGVVDLIYNRAFVHPGDRSGRSQEQEIPDDLREAAATAREQLIEMVAESDDVLLDKFFEKGTLEGEDLISGLRKSIVSGDLFPVFCVSATANIGVSQLLDHMVSLLPNPLEGPELVVVDRKTEEQVGYRPDHQETSAAFVFKTMADPFAGRITLLKVLGGQLKSDGNLRNLQQRTGERLGTLQIFQGKAHEPVEVVDTGDVCGVLKLKATTTGDTLADPSFGYLFRKTEFPEPAISFAVEPKSRGDEEKISSAMGRLTEEDPSITFRRDPETNEFLLSGTGQIHIEVMVGKLKTKYGVEVILRPPKVPYRETITGRAQVHARHKKQTGGHGQYGDCRIRMEPTPRDAGFEFVDEIFGGSIPRQYIPAVEKGIVEAASRGFLAGYPVVDFKVILYDGSYHDVDSSEMAFKIAGSLAFRQAMDQARPVLLEPIMNVEVAAPEENAGDVMGDLSSRRGRIQGMDVQGNSQLIKAQAPLAELLNYAPSLTSMTGGRGSYHMEHSHYDILPAPLAQKVIEAAKQEKG